MQRSLALLLLTVLSIRSLHAQESPGDAPPSAAPNMATRGINRAMSDLQGASLGDALNVLNGLESHLYHRYRKNELPDMAARGQLTEGLLALLERSKSKEGDREALEESIVHILAQFGDNKRGKELVFRALEHGSPRIRDAGLRYIGWGGSAIPKEERWALIERLYKSNRLSLAQRLFALKSLDEKRLRAIMEELLDQPLSKENFMWLGRYLQYQPDSAFMPKLLSRAKELALHSSYLAEKDDLGREDELGWIENRQLGACLDNVADIDLPICLEYSIKRPCAPDQCLPPIQNRDLLNHGNPAVRQSTADYLGLMARGLSIQPPDKIEPYLRRRMEVETDSTVRQALEQAIARVERGVYKWKRATQSDGQKSP